MVLNGRVSVKKDEILTAAVQAALAVNFASV